jgi:hypothetical protein
MDGWAAVYGPRAVLRTATDRDAPPAKARARDYVAPPEVATGSAAERGARAALDLPEGGRFRLFNLLLGQIRPRRARPSLGVMIARPRSWHGSSNPALRLADLAQQLRCTAARAS